MMKRPVLWMSLLGLLCGSLAFGQSKVPAELVDVDSDGFSSLLSTPTSGYSSTNRAYESVQHVLTWIDNNWEATTPGSGAAGVSSINSLTGGVTLAAGTNVTITPSGQTLTISSYGSGGLTPEGWEVITNDFVTLHEYLMGAPYAQEIPTSTSLVGVLQINQGTTQTNFIRINTNTYLTTNLFWAIADFNGFNDPDAGWTAGQRSTWSNWINAYIQMDANYVDLPSLGELESPGISGYVSNYVYGLGFDPAAWDAFVAGTYTNDLIIQTLWNDYLIPAMATNNGIIRTNALAHNYNFANPTGVFVSTLWNVISAFTPEGETPLYTNQAGFASAISNATWHALTNTAMAPAMTQLANLTNLGSQVFTYVSNIVMGVEFSEYLDFNLGNISNDVNMLEAWINGGPWTNSLGSNGTFYVDQEPWALQPLINTNFAVVSSNFNTLNYNFQLTSNAFIGLASGLGVHSSAATGTTEYATYTNMLAYLSLYEEASTNFASLGALPSFTFPDLLTPMPTNIIGATQVGREWLLDSYNTNIYLFYMFADGYSNGNRHITKDYYTNGYLLYSNHLTAVGVPATNINRNGTFVGLCWVAATNDIVDPGGWYDSDIASTNYGSITIPRDGVYEFQFSWYGGRASGTSDFSTHVAMYDPVAKGLYTYGTPASAKNSYGLNQWTHLSYEDEGRTLIPCYRILPSFPNGVTGDSTDYRIDWADVRVRYVGAPDSKLYAPFSSEALP